MPVQGTIKTIVPSAMDKPDIEAAIVQTHYTVISCLFREQSKLLTRGAGDNLRTVA
jgi:hypothetical protein